MGSVCRRVAKGLQAIDSISYEVSLKKVAKTVVQHLSSIDQCASVISIQNLPDRTSPPLNYPMLFRDVFQCGSWQVPEEPEKVANRNSN
jgi:hypothetical protein